MTVNPPSILQKLKLGYAHLLDISAEVMDKPGFTLIETSLRDRPEWANWVHPIWLFAIGLTLVCSVSPHYVKRAEIAFGSLPANVLLSAETLALARTVLDDRTARGKEWVQCEVLFYPHRQPPNLASPYQVEKLQPDSDRASRFLRGFDGGVFGIRFENDYIAAHAGIKNKGLLQEIAVGVEEGYRQRGLGKAVVAHAVAAILVQDKVPVYWPDSVKNTASYALAYSLGFEKVAEMCFCCYELPN